MPTLGIDFGADRLRVAIEKDCKPLLVEHSYEIPHIIHMPEGNPGDETGLQIVSIKRVLDFDADLPVAPSGVGSLKFLSAVLAGMRSQCELQIGDQKLNCVVAVPPCFSQRQRSSLRTAADNSGIGRVKLVDDTLAAVLAVHSSIKDCECVVVYSWGASNFSVARYEQENGVFHARAAEGDVELGVDVLDSLVARYMLDHLVGDRVVARSYRSDIDWIKLFKECRKAKHALLQGIATTVSSSDLLISPARSYSASAINLPANLLDAEVSRLLDRTLQLTHSVMGKSPDSSNTRVLLLGAMSHFPEARKMLQDRYPCGLLELDEYSVAMGSVLYGMSIPDSEWAKAERPAGVASRNSRVHSEAPETRSWARLFVPILDSAEEKHRNGDILESIKSLEKLFAELGKFSAGVYQRAATIHKDAGREESAYAVLKLANQRAPDNQAVVRDYVELCFSMAERSLKEKKPEKAVHLVDEGIQAIRNMPSSTQRYAKLLAPLYHLRGLALCSLGVLDEAERALEASIELDPASTTAVKNLEMIRTSMQRTKTSRAPPLSAAADARTWGKGNMRNQPCRCGSGKKYKHCCGRNA